MWFAINNEANDIGNIIDQEKKLKEADTEFFRATERFEEALKIEPEDPNTLTSLKQLNLMADNEDGYARIEAIIKKLGL